MVVVERQVACVGCVKAVAVSSAAHSILAQLLRLHSAMLGAVDKVVVSEVLVVAGPHISHLWL